MSHGVNVTQRYPENKLLIICLLGVQLMVQQMTFLFLLMISWLVLFSLLPDCGLRNGEKETLNF